MTDCENVEGRQVKVTKDGHFGTQVPSESAPRLRANGGHASWVQAYFWPRTVQWMLSFSKVRRPGRISSCLYYLFEFIVNVGCTTEHFHFLFGTCLALLRATFTAIVNDCQHSQKPGCSALQASRQQRLASGT